MKKTLLFFATFVAFSGSLCGQTQLKFWINSSLWDRLKDAEEAVISNSQTADQALQTVDQTVQPQMDRYCH
ncbi:MAG: hypothetical protein JO308_09670 [Verrucomicrobia bacterium]|nr:hypothetical protein [Verrucomicrobiota bacterium]